jgi:hypothetical protein
MCTSNTIAVLAFIDNLRFAELAMLTVAWSRFFLFKHVFIFTYSLDTAKKLYYISGLGIVFYKSELYILQNQGVVVYVQYLFRSAPYTSDFF